MNNLVNEAIKKILSLIVGIENKCEIMKGAASSNAGKAGLVPAPPAGETGRYLRADGTWAKPRSCEAVEGVLSPDSWVLQSGAYVYEISNSNVTASNDVVIVPKYPISIATLKKLDITSIVQTAGKIILSSNTKPDADIAITMYIYKEG